MVNPIRAYQDSDYERLKELYLHTEWYGGVFDESRDGREVLARKIVADPEAIWVYEQEDELLGTVSLIEDGRVAWLYRLVIKNNDPAITRLLYEQATTILKRRGHAQVLVYTPLKNDALHERYSTLGMNRGGNYTCYWVEL